MNTKGKKGIFWGAIVASMVLAFNVLHFLLGGSSAYARGPQGHDFGGRGMHGGGFASHQMNAPHPDGGFPWLFLIIGLAVLVLVVRWLKNKSKAASMQQFIDTSLVGTHIPVTNQNANLLDQWEKNLKRRMNNNGYF
ncbi:hypothetical protein [Neobacillus dielmonensis]|uniref:hypothetical protein n=1 Tax=Neobacillus dielmonensis TaxID=1347369 RepID=UPI0005AB57AF|nr:hypothetical protein [Neobacillus dielmonensis]